MNQEDMFQSYPDVVSVDELQQMLHIGRNAAYTLLREGKIKTVKNGKRYIIPKIYVIEYLKQAS